MKTCHPYRLVCLLSVATILSCSPYAPAVRPDAAGVLPDTFRLYGAELDLSIPWWRSMGSPELDRLIQDGLGGNMSIKSTWARLRQAKATAVQAGAARYPDLEASAAADISRSRSGASSDGAKGADNYTVGLISSYELDLWGRVESLRQAAVMDVEASREDLHAAMVTLAAEVADRWVQIISLRLQKQRLLEQLENNLTFLELIELRFRKAMVSALDVYQQQQVVENLRARIPLVELDAQLLMHELAVLLGRPPNAKTGIAQPRLPTIGPIPAIGLPVDLLAYRPDIRAAGRRLEAADWQVSAARANRLPAIRFTAAAEYGRADLDVLFDTWLLSLAANLTAPILDGGRRAAEVDRRQAQVDEALWVYRQTVLTAVKEVEDALVRETQQRAYIQGLEAVLGAARNGLREAVDRYRNGLSDYLPVLTQLLAVQDLERDLINQQERLVRYRIGLHRALGGGWTAPARGVGEADMTHNPNEWIHDAP